MVAHKASEHVKQAIRAVVPRTARNWMRSPSRSVEWLWHCAQFSLGRTRKLEVLPDWSLNCHPHAYKVAYQSQVADAEQAGEFRNFLAHCHRGMLLFDVGAHFGIFSLAAAHAGGAVIAVDPSPTAVRMIAVQSALNGCADKIRIVRAAVSSQCGEMNMLNAGVFSDGYFKGASGRSRRELTTIPTLTIDELVHQFGAPTHIKIDVEGHEAPALRGGRASLDKFSPLLFLELHNEMVLSEGEDPNSALDELDRLGYTTFSWEGHALDRKAILEKPITRIIAKRLPLPEQIAWPRQF